MRSRSDRHLDRPALTLLAVLSCGLLANACSVGPEYQPPILSTGPGWSRPAETPAPLAPDDLGRWWERFGDPTLDRLIETALENNLSVRQATIKIAEARATRDWVAGRRLPEVSAATVLNGQRLSENGLLPIDRIPDLERDLAIIDLGFDASWEADLFARTSNRMASAQARLQSAEEEHRAAHLRVVAEIARAYFALRGGQRRLISAESAVASIERTASLVRLRVDAGEAARIELVKVEADLLSLQAQLPALRAELRATALALSTLVGDLPETELGLLDQSPQPLELSPFPVGERAALLARRPDLRSAERQLAAATADIGVAMAELYPRLSIGARGGFQAQKASDLLSSASATWSIVPAFSWRVFDRGRVRAEIRIAEARAEAAALAWEAAVLTALGDAERALARYRGGLDALEQSRRAVAAASRARDLERIRYEAGETSLLALLDAERRLHEQEASLAAIEIETSGSLVSLIKALGGGWSRAMQSTASG